MNSVTGTDMHEVFHYRKSWLLPIIWEKNSLAKKTKNKRSIIFVISIIYRLVSNFG